LNIGNKKIFVTNMVLHNLYCSRSIVSNVCWRNQRKR